MSLNSGRAREYLVALSQVPRTPGWMRAMGLKPMSLGLDLRGGVHFLYEVDVKGAVKQLLAGMERDYRLLLRNERIPFTGIASDGNDTVKIDAAQRRRRRIGRLQRCASRTRTLP